jgi:integrase
MPYKEKGKYRAVVTYQGKRVATKQFRRKTDAKAWEIKTKKKYMKIAKQQQNGIILFDFCTKYLDFATRFQPKVYSEKNSVCKRILKAWGADIPVDYITPEMADDYLLEQKRLRSANAANKDRKNLKAMWKKGITTYEVKSDPFRGTTPFPHDKEPQYTPSVEDVLKVLMAATRMERIFLDCYIQTGARRSEIFRLTWNDVDFNHRTIRLSTRKTKDGSMKYRMLELSDDLYDQLWWWWNNRRFKDSPFVFVDDQKGPHYGKPYKERRRFMRGLCKRAGVKKFGFHALRRFTASVLDSKNVPLTKIQLILGHSRPSTTDRYLQDISVGKQGVMNLISEKIHTSHTHNEKKVTTDEP